MTSWLLIARDPARRRPPPAAPARGRSSRPATATCWWCWPSGRPSPPPPSTPGRSHLPRLQLRAMFQLLASGGGNGAAGVYSAGSKARTLCSSKWRFIYYLRSLIFVTRDQMNLWHLIQSIFPLNHQKSSWFKKPKYIFSARLTIGVKTNLMLKYHNNCCKMVPICLCWIWRGKSLG